MEAVHSKAETRFGLSEQARIEIWKEIVHSEDKSNLEVAQKYPSDPDKQDVQWKLLMKQYKARIAKRHKLTVDQLESVYKEGKNKDWPFPK